MPPPMQGGRESLQGKLLLEQIGEVLMKISIALCALLATSVTGCGKPREPPPALKAEPAPVEPAPARPSAPPAPSTIQPPPSAPKPPLDEAPSLVRAADANQIAERAAAVKDAKDLVPVERKCMAVAMTVGQKIGDPRKDSGYWKHCKVGLARAYARIVISLGKPGKPHALCGQAMTKADEIVLSGKPGADEMKTVGDAAKRACGF